MKRSASKLARGAKAFAAFIAFLTFIGCDSESTLLVMIEMDESIAHGIHGDGHGHSHGHDHPSAVADGWELEFERYLVHFNDVKIAKSADLSSEKIVPIRRIVDLKRIRTNEELGILEGLESGRWDRLSWSIAPPTEESDCHPRVPQAICDAMIRDGMSVLIEGSLHKDGGRSCPPNGAEQDADEIHFEFMLPVAVRFVECQSAGGEGVGLPTGGMSAIALSYHAEHLLFNAFAEGQRTIQLRAQFLANAAKDGRVTRSELESIPRNDFEALFTRCSDDHSLQSFSEGYSLSGAINDPIETLEDYLIAHLMTQGHVDGEHECAALPLEP